MLKIIRLACACLFILWLPALQAADSGWLQNPANDHAKVRLRADTSQPGRLACCCRSSCKGLENLLAFPRAKAASRRLSSGRATRRRRLVLADAAAFRGGRHFHPWLSRSGYAADRDVRPYPARWRAL